MRMSSVARDTSTLLSRRAVHSADTCTNDSGGGRWQFEPLYVHVRVDYDTVELIRIP